MNLREVIEKNQKLIWTYVPAMDDPMEPAVYESNARKAVVQGQLNLLDALIEEIEKEQKWLEQCIDRNFGDNIFADGSLAQATRIRMLLKQAREDITSLQ